MKLSNNYSLVKTFVDKKVEIEYEKEDDDKDDFFSLSKSSFNINLPTVKDFIENKAWLELYTILTKPLSELQKAFPVLNITSSYEVICFICKNTALLEYFDLAADIKLAMKFLFGDDCNWVSQKQKFEIQQFKNEFITITSQICDYVIDVIKLSCGKSITPQITPTSEEARKFFAQQKKLQEEIDALKAKKNSSTADTDDIIKVLLRITYSFPSLDIDYLFNQTLAQIYWLSKYSAESVSYQVKSQAYAAGNLKKGTKLDFFIK